jgi:hypothetical protein
MSDYRFEVALSFPGEYRSRVRKIAELLAVRLGRERVLYDKFFEAEFARPNLNVYLPKLYLDSHLLVFFHCAQYAQKEWTGVEWRVGLDLVKKREDERLMFLRLDDAEIEGLYSGDGYLDIRKLPNRVVATRILERLGAPQIEQIVRNLRAQTLPDIQNRCGTIRVLTMEHPIKLAGIYTDTNLLERRSSYIRKSREELIQEAEKQNFYRFGVTSPIVKRVPGFEVFARQQRIVIYGKPGAGKTTFLKHCAIKCSAGDFRPELVPVFVTLKHFAEHEGSPSLLAYIQRQWSGNPNTETVLREGRALILLDGLDEVRDHDFIRIRKAVEEVATDFARCTVAITCRIAAREYAFPDFAEVEMADFSNEQIEKFAKLWFASQNEEGRAEAFLQKLRSNRPIFELASSPLLLTLLLLVYQDRNDFYGTRAELYREGLDILLRKWDGKRAIERDRPYGLTISIMETLLEELAYRRFFAADYFFQQDDLEKQIAAFFAERNLLKDGDELLPEKILNSIESHLGLLVQRAVGVYSFSHLTFQEYLTARRLSTKPTLISDAGYQVGVWRWREVWLMLVTIMDADDILRRLKRHVDALVRDYPRIQNFLKWCHRKAATSNELKMASSTRAIYFAVCDWRKSALAERLDRDFARDPALAHYPNLAIDVELALVLERVFDVTQRHANDLTDRFGLPHEIASLVALGARDSYYFDDRLPLANELVEIARRGFLPVDFAKELENLAVVIEKRRSPSLGAWQEKLSELAIRCRDIGHRWGFNKEDIEDLNYYYQSNVFLLDYMEAASGLTNRTRHFIEDTLLLPAEEIQKIDPALR